MEKVRARVRLFSIFYFSFSLFQFAYGQPHPADPAADVEVQYAAVLSAMKNPCAAGVLVTEVAPESPAGAAGLRGGDIIVKLARTDVRTLPALREEVADLLAGNAVEGHDAKVLLVVRRQTADPAVKNPLPADEPVILQVPREPLGIRAIEVQAGVPAALNPPASPRGTIAMAWQELRKLEHTGGDLGEKTFFRTNEAGASGQGAWLGWQERSADPAADDALSGRVDVYRVELEDKTAIIAASESLTFRVRTGDYKTAPAFVLESAGVVTTTSYGAKITTNAQRAGALIRVQTETAWPTHIDGPDKREGACPMDTLLPAMVPLVAAAMPQQKDAVLPIHLMSARDFVARPGYVLATRGKQVMADAVSSTATRPAPASPPPAAPEAPAAGPQAWRVDLMHCGIVVESYWLTDQRRLLRVDSFSGTNLTSRHVASEDEARASAVERVQGRR